MTQLIPPNYGIIDGDAFYVNELVTGPAPRQGDRVRCEAVHNTDGGHYNWRCTRVEVEAAAAAALPNQYQSQPQVSVAFTRYCAPLESFGSVIPSLQRLLSTATGGDCPRRSQFCASIQRWMWAL